MAGFWLAQLASQSVAATVTNRAMIRSGIMRMEALKRWS
jgi:hypothetical protein